MRTYHTRPLTQRLEDLEFMAANDETLTGAAERLDMNPETLRRWLLENGHTDILNSLALRDHIRRGSYHLRLAEPGEQPQPLPDDLVTSQDLCIHAGITYRQLDYWCRTGLLVPYTDPTPGSGTPRYFEQTAVDLAVTVRRLLEAGLQPRHAFDLAHDLLAGRTPRIGVFRLVPIPTDLNHAQESA